MNSNSDYIETLRKAAEAARALIEELEGIRQSLDRKIADMRAVMVAYESYSETSSISLLDEEAESGTTRAPRGQVEEHLRRVLALGGPRTWHQLQVAMLRSFGVKYSRSAIFSALQRGKGTVFVSIGDSGWNLRSGGVGYGLIVPEGLSSTDLSPAMGESFHREQLKRRRSQLEHKKGGVVQPTKD